MPAYRIILFGLLCNCFLPSFSQNSTSSKQNITKENKKVVADFVSLIKDKNLEQLGSIISFPLARKYPIPAIQNGQEFRRRFAEVFDDSLTRKIVNSNPDKDWSTVGWRGIMLGNGDIWLDHDGRLIAVNYQSRFEKDLNRKLIIDEKNNLYPALKEFISPVCVLQTKQYKIRIDDLGDGNFRYAAWPLKSKMSDKPELILQRGEFVPEGTGGNHSYRFVNSDFSYVCSIIVMGEENSPPALLTVRKRDKLILSQPAEIQGE